MTSDALAPGEVVLIPFPYTDLSSAKQRPALVLSSREFNEGGADFVACAITSNLAHAPASVMLVPEDMKSGRLPALSRIRVGKVALLSRALVRKRLGQVRPELLRKVMQEFETLFL